jgi:hypothetical protein
MCSCWPKHWQLQCNPYTGHVQLLARALAVAVQSVRRACAVVGPGTGSCSAIRTPGMCSCWPEHWPLQCNPYAGHVQLLAQALAVAVQCVHWACAVAGPSTCSCSANHSLGCDAVKPFGGYYHQDLRARAPRSAPVLLPKYRALHAPKPQRLSISTPQGHQMLVLVLLSPRAIRARAGRGLVTTTSPSSTATPTISGALPRPSALPPNENWVLMTVIKLFHNIIAVVIRDESNSTTDNKQQRFFSSQLWFCRNEYCNNGIFGLDFVIQEWRKTP